jgi:hypothetical protein
MSPGLGLLRTDELSPYVLLPQGLPRRNAFVGSWRTGCDIGLLGGLQALDEALLLN